ncbi:hypothetical protein B0I35DRAFT_138718 [Stachybotrys elegans]|uniref:HMG box domain-containing protein n=1 Tax=Stachybotrys elegans TaxID=80388 RepID=A0A8K0WVU5_9HYPO|nr:hypothetical protein B0I35DRAFT_138718 [Stachybotrys elegans]
MLTSVGRAAAQRLVLASAAPSKLPQLATQTLALRPAVATRGFAVSAWSRAPEKASTKPKAAAKKGEKKEKKTAADKKEKKTTAADKKGKKKAAPKPKPKPKATVDPEKAKASRLSPHAMKLLPLAQRKRRLASEYVKLDLQAPQTLPTSVYYAFQAEYFAKNRGKHEVAAEAFAAFHEEWKNLPKYELDRLESIVQENQKANAQKLEEWIKSQSPESVFVANWVRKSLVRDLGKSSRKYAQLPDSRYPAKSSSWVNFVRANKGEFQDAQAGFLEVSKELSERWKTLSDAEKQAFAEPEEKKKGSTGLSRAEIKDRAVAYWKEHSLLQPFATPAKFAIGTSDEQPLEK